VIQHHQIAKFEVKLYLDIFLSLITRKINVKGPVQFIDMINSNKNFPSYYSAFLFKILFETFIGNFTDSQALQH
jgi:hypothetical protein